ncbi:MAG TPA: NAD(P)-binding protein, partial [Verrucomicrobiae bacterium]|nr:NAD(P)-binding protein [Verrucomicrobiae bacterium]
ILIGFHRTGQSLARNLPKKDLLIVDFDPEIIHKLQRYKYDFVFGDVSDPELTDKLFTPKTKLVISTSPDLEDNIVLMRYLLILKKRPKVIVRAETEQEALILYNHGADYVLLPHFASGHHLGKMIASDPKLYVLKQLKEKDRKYLSSY